MRRFDTVIMVDWSGGRAGPKRPKKDAIWACRARHGVTEPPVYLRSRVLAEDWLQETFDAERSAGRRVLTAFDFPFGYPKGFARQVIGKDDTLALWAWLAERIEDDEDGRNNRFEVASVINRIAPGPGPFWGKPSETVFPDIPYRKAGIVFAPFAERREADLVAKASSSCFQLFFNPTVGSQVLTGLPVLWRLRERGDVAVWPLEHWADAPIVLAETWPGLIEAAVRGAAEDIRDAVQVRLLARAISRLGMSELADLMENLPESTREEAWILGTGYVERLNSLAKEDTPCR